MTLLPKYDPSSPDPRAQVDRITPTTNPITPTTNPITRQTWLESTAWHRGIPIIAPAVNGAIPGTDPAQLTDAGYFDT